jgi:LEM3 (ligand-effect modulator 3) family / CDC50 family
MNEQALPEGSLVRRQSTEFVDDSESEDEENDKPVRCLKFRQQELWAVKPVWSPRCVVIMYYLVAALFIPVGVVVLVQSLRLMETDHLRYDNRAQCNVGATSDTESVKTCILPITVSQNTTAPSYLYYGLVNYFQNARRYITSRSFSQLRGEPDPDLKGCEGSGPGLEQITFCGLTANSFFNDTFDLCRDVACTDLVKLRKKGIAWDIDVEKLYRNGTVGKSGYTEESNARVSDEDFMVWMRLATYNNFHKLYRIIEDDLPEGVYYIRVNASYPVESFSGQKFVFIAETTWFGGRSSFLGYAYLAVGGFSLIMATLFAIGARRVKEAPLPPETSIPLDGLPDTPSGTTPSASGSTRAPPGRGQQRQPVYDEGSARAYAGAGSEEFATAGETRLQELDYPTVTASPGKHPDLY